METDSGDTAAGNYLELDVGTQRELGTRPVTCDSGTAASVSLQISQCAEYQVIRSGGVLHIAILGWAGLGWLGCVGPIPSPSPVCHHNQYPGTGH